MATERRLPRLFGRQIHQRGWKNHRPVKHLARGQSTHGPRGLNQDRMLIDEINGVFAVFDGVGSSEFGSKAAEHAMSAISRLAVGIPQDVRRHHHLDQITAHANTALFDAYQGSAATALAGIFQIPDGILVFHAGDTRVYRLRGGLLTRLTKDHRATDKHTGKTGITRALGAAHNFALETRFSSAVAKDTFLICSDGIHDRISDRQLEILLTSTQEIAEQEQVLSHFLHDKVPTDDATFVLIKAEALIVA